MNKKQMIIFTVAVILLCAILFMERLTGPLVHVLCGVLLCICSIKHILFKIVRIKHMQPMVKLTDEVILVSLITVAVSGMLMHPFNSALWIAIIHKLSGMIFFLGVIMHIVQHYKLGEK